MKTNRIQDDKHGTGGSPSSHRRLHSHVLATLYGTEGLAEVALGFVHWPDAVIVSALYWVIAVCLFVAMWAQLPKK